MLGLPGLVTRCVFFPTSCENFFVVSPTDRRRVVLEVCRAQGKKWNQIKIEVNRVKDSLCTRIIFYGYLLSGGRPVFPEGKVCVSVPFSRVANLNIRDLLLALIMSTPLLDCLCPLRSQLSPLRHKALNLSL